GSSLGLGESRLSDPGADFEISSDRPGLRKVTFLGQLFNSVRATPDTDEWSDTSGSHICGASASFPISRQQSPSRNNSIVSFSALGVPNAGDSGATKLTSATMSSSGSYLNQLKGTSSPDSGLIAHQHLSSQSTQDKMGAPASVTTSTKSVSNIVSGKPPIILDRELHSQSKGTPPTPYQTNKRPKEISLSLTSLINELFMDGKPCSLFPLSYFHLSL
ncbi:unnamed protein product, partial [Protopolystoma xenopodis]